MTTINKTHNDEGAASCLVVGTENKTVYILDPAAFTYLTRVSITIRIEMHYNWVFISIITHMHAITIL